MPRSSATHELAWLSTAIILSVVAERMMASGAIPGLAWSLAQLTSIASMICLMGAAKEGDESPLYVAFSRWSDDRPDD